MKIIKGKEKEYKDWYGCAVSILSQCWEYGEYLRKWHNKKYDYDGDGAVNPAIMTVGAK